ncbi:MAG: SUMF1/EgtB/PvdO family nonheme iron enzyme [Isosphaeraceae bacterium]
MKMDFISRDELIEAMGVWFLDRRKTLGEVLVERGALARKDCDLLDSMVQESQARQDRLARLSASDGHLAATRPSDSIDETAAAESGLGTDAGRTNDGELTASWSTRRQCAGNERYRVLRPHARGGIGRVSVALDAELNREVALKELLEEHLSEEDSRARFFLEAEVTARLEHPGIVPVYGIGHNTRGEPFYVMRFIKGESLKEAVGQFHQRCKASGLRSGERALQFQQLLRRFIDVCDTIEYAHSRRVIHRDLKPSNVVVGRYGETLVVDWGLAKFVGKAEVRLAIEEQTLRPSSHSGSSETVAGFAVGTPAFMSPEQAEGDLSKVGFSTDVYGPGATLYYLLTGQNPIGDCEVATALSHARRGEFPRPRQVDTALPQALEAICLKAMAFRPEDRYGSPRALARDLELWLADEPVSAWPEPPSIKLRRWVDRRRTLVSSTAAALLAVLAAGGYLVYQTSLWTARRQIEANARVDALSTAEVRAVPRIVDMLGPDRSLVRDRLESLLGDHATATAAGRLGAALALLADDSSRAQSLVARLVLSQTSPEEVLVIRQGLHRNNALQAFVKLLIAALPSPSRPLDDAALRRLGALALADPHWGGWREFAGPIAAKLVQVNPSEIAAWREVFQPVSGALHGPLFDIYAGRSTDEPKALAFSLLFEFACQADQGQRPEVLAQLLADARPGQFGQILSRLTSTEDRASAIAVLLPALNVPAQHDLILAERQARQAAALFVLGRPELLWPLLAHRDDPSLRTELIHVLPDYRLDPAILIERLKVEGDLSARRALILSLGGFEPESIPSVPRAELKSLLVSWYGSDPDPGIHGAIDWVLRRRWAADGELDALEPGLRSQSPLPGRNWWISPSGQTFAIIRGPVSFRMGTVPGSDPDAGGDEPPQDRIIDRSFAIATREVTLAEYRFFIKDNPGLRLQSVVFDTPGVRMRIPNDACAVGAVTWFDAVHYCNWLSAREGIPEDQWCYPKLIGPGLVLPRDSLARTGYRLPTEAEWEYTCRSGATTIWPHGLSPARLTAYAWTVRESGRVLHPPGLKLPNASGLFDVLGNASEWCGTLVDLMRDPKLPPPRPDTLQLTSLTDTTGIDTRGGSFLDTSADVRPANRNVRQPTERLPYFGLRLARTLAAH